MSDTLKEYTWKSPIFVTVITILLFCLYIFITAGFLTFHLENSQLTIDLVAGKDIPDEEIKEIEDNVMALQEMSISWFYICGLSFLFWVNRTVSNLFALKISDIRWTPGWSVAWCIIPFFSLFRPFQVVGDLWRGSHPDSISVKNVGRDNGLFLRTAWWLTFLGGIIIQVVILPMIYETALELDDYILPESIHTYAIMMDIAAATLAIAIMVFIAYRQTVSHNRKLIELQKIGAHA